MSEIRSEQCHAETDDITVPVCDPTAVTRLKAVSEIAGRPGKFLYRRLDGRDRRDVCCHHGAQSHTQARCLRITALAFLPLADRKRNLFPYIQRCRLFGGDMPALPQ